MRPAIALLCLFLLSSCGEPKAQVVRSDLEPIESRFPQLKGAKSAIWIGEPLGKDSRLSVPGPTIYRMKGLIFLSPQQVSDLAKYNWTPVDKMEKPNVPGHDMGSEGWFQNNEFSKALLGTRFSGAFYFKKDLGTLYFSITSN